MKIPRISNPEELVEVTFTDMGDVRAAYDRNGNAYEAYTSKFEWDGKILMNSVNRDAAKISNNPSNFRYALDCAFLKAHDLDLEKAILD